MTTLVAKNTQEALSIATTTMPNNIEEMLQVVFSYWDGSGHRKTITVAKGSTIEEFLKKALD